MSKNASSADNQQERLSYALQWYIVGFVEGEGSFHVSIQKRKDLRFGWQLIPEFRVSQRKDRISVLELIRDFFQCGYLKPNHAKRKNDQNWVYVVRNRNDLLMKIIPFFEKFPLKSEKNEDFKKFKIVTEKLNILQNLNIKDFNSLLNIIFSMNRKGIYRKLVQNTIMAEIESSETIRRSLRTAEKKI